LKKYLTLLIVIVAVSLALCACNGTASSTGTPAGNATLGSTPSSTSPHLGVQTQTAGCVAHGGLPDVACTPGAIIPTVTKDQICIPGYASSVRNVPVSEKDQVYAEYGITHHLAGQYEVDHLVSLELGGSNDIANLWPEAASPTPGFHEKDKVENYLHDQVCAGAISLQSAQQEIATNWLAVYNTMPNQ
jgi:hypothetical protein